MIEQDCRTNFQTIMTVTCTVYVAVIWIKILDDY